MKKPDNPQAFPHDTRNPYSGNIDGQNLGMTLRDYFAAKSISEIIAYEGHKAFENSEEGFKSYSESMAKKAYGIADAMLKQREL